MGGPLNVSIVGAGIAGLAAAIALRRNGHHVQIFESAEIKTEIGAAIVVPVNVLLVLDHFGYKRENLRSVDFVGAETFNALGGERNPTTVWKEMEGKVGVTCARTDLHRELERLAVGPGEGPPAVVRLGSKVVNCNPEEGSLTLSDGSVVRSDLVLGADGISSTIRTHILGYEQKSVSTGLTTSRVLLDVSSFEAVPELAWIREGVSGLRNVAGSVDRFRFLSLYPCRSGTVINFIALVEDPHHADPDWTASGTRETLLAEFSSFHPKFQALFVLLPERLSRWQLRFLPVLPTWVRGHAALLGDAAHATLPSLGQGAAQAIEDAGALGVLLSAGTPRTEVPARLAAYEGLRKERTELIGRESHDQMMVPREFGKYARDHKLQAYVVGYDVLAEARKDYEERFGGGHNV